MRGLLTGLLLWSACGVSFGYDGLRVLNDDAHYPEGPVWYHDKLYYVEYDRNAVMTWDGERNTVFASDQGCGQSAVVPYGRGELLTTCYDGNRIGRMTLEGRLLPPLTHDKQGHPFAGPNDFAPDQLGGVYFTASGTHPPGHAPVMDGKVFYLAADAIISQVATGLHNANGLAVSNDGRTLYVVETDENRLLRFTIGAHGALTHRHVFVNLDALTGNQVHIWPDGVKIDSHGAIYVGQSPREEHVALAGIIFVLDADARLQRTLGLPSLQVPNFAFSPDEKTLYVTAVDQIDEPPFRGKLYALPNP